MAKVYCLKEKQTSGECHLFECEMATESQCRCARESVCEKMKETERVGVNIFSCINPEETRLRVARIGPRVCGTCVGHLYETYEETIN